MISLCKCIVSTLSGLDAHTFSVFRSNCASKHTGGLAALLPSPYSRSKSNRGPRRKFQIHNQFSESLLAMMLY